MALLVLMLLVVVAPSRRLLTQFPCLSRNQDQSQNPPLRSIRTLTPSPSRACPGPRLTLDPRLFGDEEEGGEGGFPFAPPTLESL